MKLGLFSDVHYRKHPLPERKYTAFAPERVKEVMDIFEAENVDMVVCLGDFVDRSGDKAEDVACWKELMDIIHRYPMPYYMVPGNHDYEFLIGDEFGKVSGMKKYPFYVDKFGCRSIFLDACYRASGQRYDVAGMVWTDTILPEDQVDFLKKSLDCDKKCVVFVHQNLDKNIKRDYRIRHSTNLRQLLKNSGQVALVVNGHYHQRIENVIGGVRYLTVPSLTDNLEKEYVVLEI